MNYSNSKDLEVIIEPRINRKYLVLVRVGSKQVQFTPRNTSRNYDIGFNFYSVPYNDFYKSADLVCQGGMSKFYAAKLLSKILLKYQGVLFLDYDLRLLFDPDDFFQTCQQYNLDLAQASVSKNYNIKMTKHCPECELRYTNWIEVMGPYMSKDFLTEMIHSFDLTLSTWGLDVYWGFHLGQRKAAIIDKYQMEHSIPFDINGEFYQYLKSMNVDPDQDLNKILSLLGINRYVGKVISAVPTNDLTYSEHIFVNRQ